MLAGHKKVCLYPEKALCRWRPNNSIEPTRPPEVAFGVITLAGRAAVAEEILYLALIREAYARCEYGCLLSVSSAIIYVPASQSSVGD